MWNTILRWTVKFAIYAANHPDQVKLAVDAVVAAKQKQA